jgi:hypothetical protein
LIISFGGTWKPKCTKLHHAPSMTPRSHSEANFSSRNKHTEAIAGEECALNDGQHLSDVLLETKWSGK